MDTKDKPEDAASHRKPVRPMEDELRASRPTAKEKAASIERVEKDAK